MLRQKISIIMSVINNQKGLKMKVKQKHTSEQSDILLKLLIWVPFIFFSLTSCAFIGVAIFPILPEGSNSIQLHLNRCGGEERRKPLSGAQLYQGTK